MAYKSDDVWVHSSPSIGSNCTVTLNRMALGVQIEWQCTAKVFAFFAGLLNK